MTLEDLIEHDPEGRTRFRCPLCESSSRCLGVELSEGMYHCFRCGAAGVLGDYGRPGFVPPPAPPKRNDWRRLWNDAETIKPVWSWRGISSWSSARYHSSFYHAPCVVFPLVNWCANLTGCQGRKIPPHTGSKTLTARGSTAGLFVTSAFAWRSDPLILTEGPMDALSLEEIGYPAMATFGLQLPKWINRLTWWRRIAIATDADGPGDAAAVKWAATLLCRGSQRLRPQRGKDWNDWLTTDPEGMRRYLEQEVFRHNYPRNCPFGMIIPSRREEWGGLATEIEVERGG
jgi:hypothetical protein